MTKVFLLKFLALFFIVFSVFSAYGQKVKYKDIYALLSTKQYEQAEPFLKKYLKDNDDNPNAFLYMGIVFQEKSLKNDILKQTKASIANMDSATIFYEKAYKVVDDREVRRNKEYYQAYNRRDLRTGEFGVKLSDIQFDIQKKVEGIKERIDKVKMVKHYFSLADTLYKKSNSLFVSIQNNFPSERQLYLRADENTVKDLSLLSVKFDSCVKAFENYKASSSSLGKTGYNQVLSSVEINDFKKDGAARVDFYQDNVEVWDYKKFAEKSKAIIEKEIFPMREHLLAYDVEINKLRERLNNDSLSVRSDLTKLIDKLLYEQLRKFDPDPLPMEVFSLKTSDLEYRSSILENKALRDSSNVHLQLTLINTEVRYLHKLDSIATKLSKSDIDQKALDYAHFISNTYSNTAVLKSYISTLYNYSVREKTDKQKILANRMNALRWVVDGLDSIPLAKESISHKYKPLYILSEKYTFGLSYKDSLSAEGYFYTIVPSRKPEVKIPFQVDKAAFKESRLPSTKALTYSDGAGQIYYVLVYGERAVKDKYPASLAKIYRSDGLAWNSNYQLGFLPKEINFRPDTGELIIKNDTQLTVIDKNGKIIK
jgi:hypothetical protein